MTVSALTLKGEGPGPDDGWVTVVVPKPGGSLQKIVGFLVTVTSIEGDGRMHWSGTVHPRGPWGTPPPEGLV